MFIVFEGGEGAGKTLQTSLLANALKKRKKKILITKEPRKEMVKHIFKDGLSPMTELFLFLADRVEHVEKIVKPALNKGIIVISDRYYLSTLAYQGYGRGIDIPLIERLNKEATGGIFPQIIFFLDIPPKRGLLRTKMADRIEKEDISFHERVREGYLVFAKKEPERIQIIDGRKNPGKIHKIVMKKIDALLK